MIDRKNLDPILETLELLDLSGQLAAIKLVAIQTHGFFKPADAKSNWDSQETSFRAHDIYVSDFDAAAAMRSWINIARKAAAQYARARHSITILKGGSVSDETLREACQTIIDDRQEFPEIRAAEQELKELDRAAA